ncbi:hypothetical protein HY991_02870 [Candidatus Micrarchaeota archaeon]|nr:hypothetical protein [Candidatus Micrarchaeota archaeon]
MVLELSYEALRKIQLQEKHYSSLTKLEDDFFLQYRGWLKDQLKKLKGDFSLDAVKVYENALRILNDVAARRQQKIILKALKDLRSDDLGSPVLLEGLTNEEKELYSSILKLLNDYESKVIHSLVEARPPVSVAEETPAEEVKEAPSEIPVRILVDLPEIVGPDSKTYGPFAASQTIILSKEIASLLIRKNAAEEIKPPAAEQY